MDDKEILRRVIQGFELIPAKQGFGHPYVTKSGAATPELAKRITTWINQNFTQSHIIASYEGAYKTINFRKVMAEHIIFEHIIRQILEAGYTSLGIGSFRGKSHEDRLNKFVDYIKAGDAIPLKNGKSIVVNKVQIITKADKEKDKDLKPEEKGTSYQANSSNDMDALKLALPKLSAGDQLYLYGPDGKHSITTVTKTPELGGKGKGYQRGSEAEAVEVLNIQKQIDEFKPEQGGITVVGAGNNIVGIKKVEGMQKADFKFVDEQGNAIAYIQHKSPKHQQMSGIGRDPIRKFEEVQRFAKEVYDLVESSPEKRLKGPYSKLVESEELKELAIYGVQEEGPKGVQFYCIGSIELKPIGDNKFELVAPRGQVYKSGQIPQGEEAPTLVATYRAGRNQKVPGTNLIIPDTRIGIYPASYVSKS